MRPTTADVVTLGDSGVSVGTAGWGTAKASFYRSHARAYKQKMGTKDMLALDSRLRDSGLPKEVGAALRLWPGTASMCLSTARRCVCVCVYVCVCMCMCVCVCVCVVLVRSVYHHVS